MNTIMILVSTKIKNRFGIVCVKVDLNLSSEHFLKLNNKNIYYFPNHVDL